MTVSAGARLGPYEILDLVGAGGMGEVYRARDPRLGRDVAIKVLPADVVADPDHLQRFEREARAVAALNHPNILTVYDVGTHDGAPYVVTELLQGETLRELVSRRVPTSRQVLGFAVQIAQGLAAAHAKGILHRDVKPGNVFVTVDGRVKLLDFGLAKLVDRGTTDSVEPTESSPTQAGRLLGTVGYMSPEQARALPLDERTDLFSFGVVLYELLSGKHPFLRKTVVGTLTAIVEETPPELSTMVRGIPPAVSGIVGRCLEKEREQRFRTAHDLALSLEAVLQAPAGSAALEEVEEKSPYPGLMSFTEKDAASFFGREQEVAALWSKLRAKKLLAVIAPSGAGKTSLVRAGVVASRPEGWATVVCTPGAAPLRGLGRALVPELSGDAEALGKLVDIDDPAVAFEVVSRWRRGHPEALVVVDQFEELFTLNPEPVQAPFAALLGRLAHEADVHVLLSLRDDFLIRCSEHDSLAPVFLDLTPLPALSRDGLRRALVEPAGKRGYRFEDDALVEEMVDSVEGTRGALPLLAFAVSRLWEKRDREKKLLTRATYEEIGGVAGALAQHAEATLDRIGTERQGMVREIFRNLATSQGTRAVAEREELLSLFPERKAAEDVLRELIDARLLTSYEVTSADAAAKHRIEIVHESLLKAWPRLVRWQAQDEEGALLRDQLKQAAHLWEEKGRSPDLLWSGTSFREYELWRERYLGKLTALEEDFARSMTERARRRKRLRRAAVVSVIVALAAVAITIGLSRQQAMRARDRAQAEARRAEASNLLALGRAELDRYPTAAVAYARKSLEIADTPEGRRFAVDALWRSPTARILPLGNEVAWRADFSPDGRWLAAFPFSGRLLLFGDDGGAPRIIQGQPSTAYAVPIRFTPSGDALLAQSLEEARVHMYSVPDGREIRRFEPEPPGGYGAIPRPKPGTIHMIWTPLPQGILFQWWPGKPSPGAREPFGIWPYDGGPPTLIGSLRFPAYAVVDPRGSRLLLRRGPRLALRPLVGGDDDTVEKPLVTAGEIDPTWWAHSIDPAGVRVWAGDIKEGAGRLRVWSIGPGAPPEPRVFSMPKPDGNFVPVWDPSGSRVAWGSSAENAVWLWDLAGPPDAAPVILRRSDTEGTKQGVFAPDRDWLLVTHQGPLTFWALAQPWARVLTGHAGIINRLVFTRDSQTLLSCGIDSVRLWPLSPRWGGMRRIATDYEAWCQDAALSPDDHGLLLVGSTGAWLTPSFDGKGRRFWDGEGDHPYYVGAAAWELSGRRVAVASSYTTTAANAISVFDLVTGTERTLSLVPAGEAGQGYEWGVQSLAFTPEGRLLAGGSGGVRWIDPDTGASDWLWRLPKEKAAPFALSADGRRLVAASQQTGTGQSTSMGREVLFVDLGRGESHAIRSHGDGVTAVGLDPAGRTLVTGDERGVVHVGLADGSEPHRLCCHVGKVTTVAIAPDGKWIASAAGGEIRLWPMPDLSKPPLHTLPYDQLLAKLHTLTNLRVVEDPTSATGYKLDIGPFPGWKDVPTW